MAKQKKKHSNELLEDTNEYDLSRVSDIEENKRYEKTAPERIKLLKEIFYPAFDSCTSTLAEKLDLTSEHFSRLKKIGIVFASEKIFELEEKLNAQASDQRTADKANILLNVAHTLGKRFIEMEIDRLKNSFASYCEEENIIQIGILLEDEIIKVYQEKKPVNCFAAAYLGGELGHGVVRLCRVSDNKKEKETSQSVSEFYDAIGQTLLLEEKLFMQATRIIENKSGKEIRKRILDGFEEDGKFFEYWLENKNEKSIEEIIESFKKEGNTFDCEKQAITDCQKYREPVHECGCYIFTELEKELKKAGVPEEDRIFMLAKIAGKALYDIKIDFSDPLTFISDIRDNYIIGVKREGKKTLSKEVF